MSDPTAAAPAASPAPAAAPAPAAVAAPAPVAAAPAPAAGTPAAAPAPAPAAEPLTNIFDEPAEGESAAAPPAEAKPGEGEAKLGEKPPEAPAEIELKVPEGANLPDEVLSGVKATLKALGVTPAQAQPLFDKFVAGVQAAGKTALDAAVAQFADMQRQWQAEVRADPDIGGAKFNEAIADTRKGATTLLGNDGAKALFQALNITGAGNHPAIVKAMHKAFSIHAPAKPSTGAPAGSAKDKGSTLAGMYPSAAGGAGGTLSPLSQ
jgi:hypothetical protein